MEEKKVITLGQNLFQEYKLFDWKLKLTNAKRAFGCCHYGIKTISISAILSKLNSIDVVKDVLLHEIAHALIGIGSNHNKVWKRKAIEIGCNGKRCYDSDVVIQPKFRYVAVCSNCNNEVRACRLPKNRGSCSQCSDSFNPKYILHYRRDNNV